MTRSSDTSSSSETTGLQKLGSVLESAIGTLRSGHGSTALARTNEVDQVRAWLVQRHPKDVDRALQTSLRSTLDVEVSPILEGRFPVTGGYYNIAVGCNVGGIGKNLPAAIAKIEAAMTPPTKEQAEQWLVMLQAATVGARRSDEMTMIQYEMFSGHLMRFPADVAKAACEKLSLGKPGVAWMPTLGEINSECEKLASPRQCMLAALKRARIEYESR